MDASGAMRGMVEACGLTHKQIENRGGMYGGWIGQSLARPKPGADLLASIATACGYRLELVPLDGGAPIVIGDDDDQRDDSAADRVAQARALVHRAAALLDDMEE